MNKKLVTFVVIAVVTLTAIGGFTILRNQKTDTPASSATQQSPPKVATEDTKSQTNKTGAYVDYSASAAQSATGTRILFFHAPWCPQCRQLDASIKSGTLPNNVTIFKTDYDSNQALRKKYGVTIQTTLVKIDADDKLVKKYVAYDEPTLESVSQNLLP